MIDRRWRRWTTEDLELGEGPRWVDGRLVLVDIVTGRLLECDPENPGRERVLLTFAGLPLGAAATVRGRPSTWIVALGDGVAIVDESDPAAPEWLWRPPAGAAPTSRVNDGVCDPSGRFWFGTMAVDASPGGGSLYRVDHDGSVQQVLSDLGVVNGPAFTDGTRMYLADSAARTVRAFEIDLDSGRLGAPAPFISSSTARPDGMTVDDDGCLWVAMWDGAAVRRYSPDGVLLENMDMPVPRPTAPCLTDDGRLFVTSAWRGLRPRPKGSGAVWETAVRATAPAAVPFG